MRKIGILFLSALSAVTMAGCDESQPTFVDANLAKHLEMIDALDSYVIEFKSEKIDNGYNETNYNYVYVDNTNETFVVSVIDKEDESVIENTDLVFQYEDEKLYNFLYDDVWIKHEIDYSFINVIDFEEAVFDYLCSVSTEETDTEIIYTSSISLLDVQDSGYTAFGGGIPDKYYSVEVPLSIVYSKAEERFSSFEFDFYPVLEAMDKDQGLQTLENDSWKISFEYTRLNNDFTLVVDEYVIDDFIDDFSQEAINEIKALYSYELINGCVNYNSDQDLMKVQFEEAGLYQLTLRTLEGVSDLVITIMDSHHNVIRTFNLNNDDDHTSYWSYAKGTYYILVSGVLEEASADYSLIFMSN